eukprot:2431521-Rhodomonas_salina.1
MAPASTTPRDSWLETDLLAELRATEAGMAQAEDELRPKLDRPWKFEGHYSKLVNVLTWLKAVGQYLNQCS